MLICIHILCVLFAVDLYDKRLHAMVETARVFAGICHMHIYICCVCKLMCQFALTA